LPASPDATGVVSPTAGRFGAAEFPATRFADVVVVSPQDRLDHANSEAFWLALEPHLVECRPGGVRVVIDLSDLCYVSSAGLRSFLLAAKRAKAQDGEVVIAGMQSVVREIFEISRFTLLFRVFPDVATALDALSPAAAHARRAR
jgi:anti-anti-sigma factor